MKRILIPFLLLLFPLLCFPQLPDIHPPATGRVVGNSFYMALSGDTLYRLKLRNDTLYYNNWWQYLGPGGGTNFWDALTNAIQPKSGYDTVRMNFIKMLSLPETKTAKILYYDPITKMVTYGDSSKGGGTNYWTRANTTLYPTISTDTLKLPMVKPTTYWYAPTLDEYGYWMWEFDTLGSGLYYDDYNNVISNYWGVGSSKFGVPYTGITMDNYYGIGEKSTDVLVVATMPSDASQYDIYDRTGISASIDSAGPIQVLLFVTKAKLSNLRETNAILDTTSFWGNRWINNVSQGGKVNLGKWAFPWDSTITNNLKLKNPSEVKTNKILYYNPTTKLVTYGDSSKATGGLQWTDTTTYIATQYDISGLSNYWTRANAKLTPKTSTDTTYSKTFYVGENGIKFDDAGTKTIQYEGSVDGVSVKSGESIYKFGANKFDLVAENPTFQQVWVTGSATSYFFDVSIDGKITHADYIFDTTALFPQASGYYQIKNLGKYAKPFDTTITNNLKLKNPTQTKTAKILYYNPTTKLVSYGDSASYSSSSIHTDTLFIGADTLWFANDTLWMNDSIFIMTIRDTYWYPYGDSLVRAEVRQHPKKPGVLKGIDVRDAVIHDTAFISRMKLVNAQELKKAKILYYDPSTKMISYGDSAKGGTGTNYWSRTNSKLTPLTNTDTVYGQSFEVGTNGVIKFTPTYSAYMGYSPGGKRIYIAPDAINNSGSYIDITPNHGVIQAWKDANEDIGADIYVSGTSATNGLWQFAKIGANSTGYIADTLSFYSDVGTFIKRGNLGKYAKPWDTTITNNLKLKAPAETKTAKILYYNPTTKLVTYGDSSKATGGGGLQWSDTTTYLATQYDISGLGSKWTRSNSALYPTISTDTIKLPKVRPTENWLPPVTSDGWWQWTTSNRFDNTGLFSWAGNNADNWMYLAAGHSSIAKGGMADVYVEYDKNGGVYADLEAGIKQGSMIKNGDIGVHIDSIGEYKISLQLAMAVSPNTRYKEVVLDTNALYNASRLNTSPPLALNLGKYESPWDSTITNNLKLKSPAETKTAKILYYNPTTKLVTYGDSSKATGGGGLQWTDTTTYLATQYDISGLGSKWDTANSVATLKGTVDTTKSQWFYAEEGIKLDRAKQFYIENNGGIAIHSTAKNALLLGNATPNNQYMQMESYGVNGSEQVAMGGSVNFSDPYVFMSLTTKGNKTHSVTLDSMGFYSYNSGGTSTLGKYAKPWDTTITNNLKLKAPTETKTAKILYYNPTTKLVTYGDSSKATGGGGLQWSDTTTKIATQYDLTLIDTSKWDRNGRTLTPKVASDYVSAQRFIMNGGTAFGYIQKDPGRGTFNITPDTTLSQGIHLSQSAFTLEGYWKGTDNAVYITGQSNPQQYIESTIYSPTSYHATHFDSTGFSPETSSDPLNLGKYVKPWDTAVVNYLKIKTPAETKTAKILYYNPTTKLVTYGDSSKATGGGGLQWADTLTKIATAYDISSKQNVSDTSTKDATRYWVGQNYAPISHTQAISTITGLQDSLTAKIPMRARSLAGDATPDSVITIVDGYAKRGVIPTYWTQDHSEHGGAGRQLYPNDLTDSIGIGINEPTAKLDVRGGAYIYYPSGNALWTQSTNGYGVLATSTNSIGISAQSTNNTGLNATGALGGVDGNSTTGFGVAGSSVSGSGVTGHSHTGFAGNFDGRTKVDTLLMYSKLLGTSDSILVREGNTIKYKLGSSSYGGYWTQDHTEHGGTGRQLYPNDLNDSIGIGTNEPLSKFNVIGQIRAEFTGNTSIYGDASGSGGIGVHGNVTSGSGIKGSATTGRGLNGESMSGYGVYGKAYTGYAGYFDGRTKVDTMLMYSKLLGTSDSILVREGNIIKYKIGGGTPITSGDTLGEMTIWDGSAWTPAYGKYIRYLKADKSLRFVTGTKIGWEDAYGAYTPYITNDGEGMYTNYGWDMLDLKVRGLDNDGSPDSMLTIKNGVVYRSLITAGGLAWSDTLTKLGTRYQSDIKQAIADTSTKDATRYWVGQNYATTGSLTAKVNVADSNKTSAGNYLTMKRFSDSISSHYSKTATDNRLSLKVAIADSNKTSAGNYVTMKRFNDSISTHYSKTATDNRLALRVLIADSNKTSTGNYATTKWVGDRGYALASNVWAKSDTTATLETKTYNNSKLALKANIANPTFTTNITTPKFTLTQGAINGGAGQNMALLTGGSQTGIDASSEVTDVYFNLNRTIQHNQGALADQRSILISTPTLSFTGASTVTDADGVTILGPPSGGTNATITEACGLAVETKAITNTALGIGIKAYAPTGATINLAGDFRGKVGIGSLAYYWHLLSIGADATNVNAFNLVHTPTNKNRTTIAQSRDSSAMSTYYTSTGSPTFEITSKTGTSLFKVDSVGVYKLGTAMTTVADTGANKKFAGYYTTTTALATKVNKADSVNPTAGSYMTKYDALYDTTTTPRKVLNGTLANTSVSAPFFIYFVANETQGLGDVCFINSSGKAQIAKADAIANTNAVLFMAVQSNTANAMGKYMAQGTIRNDSWSGWTVGTNIYLSTTGTTTNTITQTAPTGSANVVQMMGTAVASKILWFNGQTTAVEKN